MQNVARTNIARNVAFDSDFLTLTQLQISYKIQEELRFRDLKSLLALHKITNKSRQRMEKIVAMMLLAYSIALLIGEEIRDGVYNGRKWKLYSALLNPAQAMCSIGQGNHNGDYQPRLFIFMGMVLGDV